MRLAEVVIYPVKGCRGVALEAAEVEPRGLRDDRRWMLVDARGRFVSQRELPALARLRAEPNGAGLRLWFDGMALEVEQPSDDAPRLAVTVWNDALSLPEAAGAAEWLRRAFAAPLRLVRQSDDARRPVADWGAADDEANLADGFPLLIATRASLAAFNRAAPAPLGMERFRPNLVIDGGEPWAEDGWARLRIGAVELDLVKPCARCKVTTVDQAAGRFDGEEPLATLRRLRMSGDRRVPGVLFGWNAAPRRLGVVRVGDAVEVLATRQEWPIRPAA